MFQSFLNNINKTILILIYQVVKLVEDEPENLLQPNLVTNSSVTNSSQMTSASELTTTSETTGKTITVQQETSQIVSLQDE